MNFRNRLNRFEQRLAHTHRSGPCQCPDRSIAVVSGVSWHGQPATEPPSADNPTCPRCGAAVECIVIIEDENWYRNDAHDLAREREAEKHN